MKGKKDDRDTDASEVHFCGDLAMRSDSVLPTDPKTAVYVHAYKILILTDFVPFNRLRDRGTCGVAFEISIMGHCTRIARTEPEGRFSKPTA